MNTKRLKLLFSLLVVFNLTTAFAQPCKEVVGYYPNWQWYDRGQIVNPQTLDYSKYSILNYCFFNPQPDGSIITTDAWADENLLLGQPDWVNGGYLPNTSVVDLAHNNNVKILPSIGGWTLSDNFPAIAASPTLRANFAQACVNLIQQYNFDGIDLDWEYPGYAPHGGSPADFVNFTLLLQEVRTAIDNYGVSVGKPMLLTVAVGAGPARMADVDWAAVTPLLDIINLMSYDFFGAWDATTNHNSPLTAPAQGDPTFNLDYAVNALINTYNVPANKITVGVAFYGRSSKTSGTPGLHTPNNGSVDGSTFSEDAGSPLYYNIMKNMNLFTQHWDATAQVPYLTGNGSLNTFVSYDNEQSIGLKAQFVVDNNLRGAIIWEITGDYMETTPGSGVLAGTPLADTLNNVFCNYTGGGSAPSVSVTGNQTICEGESTIITASGANTYSWNTGATTASITVSPNTTTTYTVTGSNNFGTDTETFTITVNPLPATPVIVNNIGVLDAQVAGVSYQWFLNGSPIAGATSQTYTPTQAGDYTVEVTSQEGCSVLSALYTFGSAPTVSITGTTSICEGESVTLTANGADSYQWGSGETTPSITVSPTSTTTYDVTGTNSFGTDNSSITVIVHPLPTPPTILENNGVLESSVTAFTYQWYLDGNPISGANAQTYTPTQDGNYSVEITDQNGCSATSDHFTWETNGIDDLQLVTRYYPNPTNGTFTIERQSSNEVNIYLLDITGKMIHAFEPKSGQKIQLDFKDFNVSEGTYFVRIQGEQQTIQTIRVNIMK